MKVFTKLKQDILDRCRKIPKDILKKQIAVLAISLILTALSCLYGMSRSEIQPGNLLLRNGYGKPEKNYDLQVFGLEGEDPIPLSVKVSPRRYTMEEADMAFSEILEHIESIITAEEDSLDAVRGNLKLPSAFPEYGVSANWSFYPEYTGDLHTGGLTESQGKSPRDSPEKAQEGTQAKAEDYKDGQKNKNAAQETDAAQAYYQKYRELVEENGTVHNETLSEGEEVSGYLSLVLSTYIAPSEEGEEAYLEKRYKSEAFKIYINILPRTLGEKEKLWKALQEALEKSDTDGLQTEGLRLPSEVAGRTIRFSEKTDHTYLYFPFLGLLAAAALYAQQFSRQKEEQKKRENQLMLDYSELVSKLMVYIGAGLTIRNAFEKISSRYDALVESGTHENRYLYDELRTMLHQFQRNIPESEVYLSFGRRINLRSYTKLVSLIEQNRKNGSKNLKSLFRMEMEDAFEQRKTTAKRLGEEAGTKLLGPLFLQLGIVMAIVIVPAMSALS